MRYYKIEVLICTLETKLCLIFEAYTKLRMCSFDKVIKHTYTQSVVIS